MAGHLDNYCLSGTPFPSFHNESSAGMWCIYALLKLNQCLLIPQRLPGDVHHQPAAFLLHQSGHIPADTWL